MNKDRDKVTFTLFPASPEAITASGIRTTLADVHEPFRLFEAHVFDHNGPFPGGLDVVWQPDTKRVTLCWDGSADVPRLKHEHLWWDGVTESADALSAVDGIDEYLNEHDEFVRPSHHHISRN